MRGKELQKAVTDLMTLHQWRWTHFQSVLATGRDGQARWRTPLSGSKGFPDIFAVRGERALAVEIKGDGDNLKDEQRQWLFDLETAGVEAFVFTPASWREGFVDSVLKR